MPGCPCLLAWTDNPGKQRSGPRLVHPYTLHLHEVEVGARRVLVQSRYRAYVLGAGVGRDPDRHVGIQHRQVREHLAEMLVVGRLPAGSR